MKPYPLVAAFAAALQLPTVAQAESYLFSTWLEPNHIITVKGHTEWAESLREASGGDLDFEVFVGGTLIPAVSTMQGVGSGLAQAGHHAATYTPSDLRLVNAIHDIGHETPDSFVLPLAFADYMMHEPAGYEDWRKNGVVFGGGHATPIQHFLCRGDVATLQDMRGLRVRTAGGGYARFVESIGAVNVSMPASEIYTAMERGAVDCTLGEPNHLTTGASILDLVGSVVQLPVSPNFATSTYIYNADFWAGLTPEQRALLFSEGAKAIADMLVTYNVEAGRNLDLARAAGVNVVEPDPALTEAYAAWVADGVGGMAEIAQNQHGVADPQALFDGFRSYVAKWEGLLEGVDRTDPEAVRALMQAQIYDRLDPATYGVE